MTGVAVISVVAGLVLLNLAQQFFDYEMHEQAWGCGLIGSVFVFGGAKVMLAIATTPL